MFCSLSATTHLLYMTLWSAQGLQDLGYWLFSGEAGPRLVEFLRMLPATALRKEASGSASIMPGAHQGSSLGKLNLVPSAFNMEPVTTAKKRLQWWPKWIGNGKKER